jgi:PIN domain nuclease of toxin-antitoxin system
VKALLDIHALLWFVLDDPALPDAARRLIADRAHRILVSPDSYWEIAIKISIGKYRLDEPLHRTLERELAVNDFEILPILPRHMAWLTDLPFHHRDPFDRLLIAQALAEQVPLISADPQLDAYPVKRLWRSPHAAADAPSDKLQ